MKTKRMLIALLAICLFLSACNSAPATTTSGGDSTVTSTTADSEAETPDSEATKDTIVVAIPDAPNYMDPMIQASIATFRVTTQIFDRLLQMDRDMKMVPMLAESWDVVDDKTTVFHLRQGVKFHNGETMTAEDVKFSLERTIESPGVNYNYLIIDSIEIEDDYTVKVTTKEPFNALLYRLTLDAASIVSKKAVEELGEDFNKAPVGAGPYKFKSWDVGGDVVLEAFDDYWAGAPKTKTLIFRQIPEALNRTIGLETDTVDIAYDLAVTDVETVKNNDKLKLEEVLSNTIWYLGFNCEKEPLDNVLVRQAIAYAINVEDVITIAFGGAATPADNSMIPPKVSGHVPNKVKYDTDVDKAKELLAEAGYEDGFSITLWSSDSQIMREIGVVIQDQLRRVGINAEIKSMEQGAYYSATGNGDHEMFLMSKTSIDPDSALRAMYHTEAFGLSGNRSFWATDEVDGLLDEAATSTDAARVLEIYEEIQQIIGEAMPLVPLAVEHINAGLQAEIEGFGLYPGKSHYIYDAYFAK